MADPAVAAAAGVDAAAFAPDLRPSRPGEVLRSCLDVSRARGELGLAAPTELTDGPARHPGLGADAAGGGSGMTSRVAQTSIPGLLHIHLVVAGRSCGVEITRTSRIPASISTDSG